MKGSLKTMTSINKENSWKSIVNSFGGSEFLSVKNIIEIKEGKIITEFLKFDEEVLSYADTAMVRATN